MLLKIKLIGIGLLGLMALALAVVRGQALHYWVVAALLLSWLGDAMLGRFTPITRLVSSPFLAGMGLFAGAQLCYCMAFGLYLRSHPQTGSLTPVIMGGAVVIAVLAWFLLVARARQPMVIRGVSLAYALLLLSMAGLAFSAGLRGGQFIWPLLAGSVLFVVSDGLIAASTFLRKDIPHYEALVWLTYAPAQILLLLGTYLLH